MSRVLEVGSAANSYEILTKLAEGGMAEIFLARGVSASGLQRYVVLKRILRERASDAQFVQMLLDEARLAAQLQHPNIAQVYDIGQIADSYFFTMEYVHGETVRTLLHQAQRLRRPLPIACVLAIAAGTAAGLHHAHERKGITGQPLDIVHRDVSPSNLMVSYEGHVKVVDFGVAKASDRLHETQSGTVKGKICYLSPEQVHTGPIDRRSDLFGLGIVLWEMLTGERLYRRASDFENMTAIVGEAPAPPSQRRAEVTPEVDAIVMKLLAKSPRDRFQTADELVERIEDYATRSSASMSPSSLARLMREMFGTKPDPWIDTGQKPSRFTVTSSLLRDPPSVSGSLPEGSSSDVVGSSRMDEDLARTMRDRPRDDDDDLIATRRGSGRNIVNSVDEGAVTIRGSSRSLLPLPVAPATLPAAPGPSSRRAIAIVAGCAVAGAGIALAVLQPWRHDAATAPGDAPQVAVAPSAPAPEVILDATPEVILDATPEVIIDATPEVIIDAPIAAAKPVEARPVRGPVKPDVAALFAAAKFSDVVAACSASAATLKQAGVMCIGAACRVGNASLARAWLRAQQGSHDALIAACRSVGVELQPAAPPRVAPDAGVNCDVDPMACMH